MSASTSLNTGQSARDIQYGVVQYLSRSVSFDTLGIGTADTVYLGVLPAGSQILHCTVRVTTAFNAATTNVLTVGTSSSTDTDVVNSTDVDESVAGTAVVYRGCDLNFASDTPIYVRYTQTGTAATTGAAKIVLAYVAMANG